MKVIRSLTSVLLGKNGMIHHLKSDVGTTNSPTNQLLHHHSIIRFQHHKIHSGRRILQINF